MAQKPRILIVEDEASIADNIIYALKADGFECEWVELAADGLTYVQSSQPDLLILDIGLPDYSGFELCKQIRAFSGVPIIFLSARSDEIDRVVGLEIGADDYVIKPFSPRELVARVKARLRSFERLSPVAQSSKSSAAPVDTSWFHIDGERKQIQFQQQPLNLTVYEYGILCALLQQPERVFSREQLMNAVWEMPEVSLERAVDTHIKSIRSKLKTINAEISPIKTHRGLGYSIGIKA